MNLAEHVALHTSWSDMTTADAVRAAIASRLAANVATGHGNRAARREADALTDKRHRMGLTFFEATRRMKLQRQAQLAAEAAEERGEGRTLAAFLTNIHD